MDYFLYAVLPTLRVRKPLSCGPVIFCTTHHVDSFRIIPESDVLSIRSLQTRFRTSFGEELTCLGLEIVPTESADALACEALPRAARDGLALSFITKGTAQNCHLEQRILVFEADFFDALPIRLRDAGFVIDRPGLLGINTDLEGYQPTLRTDLHEPHDNEFRLDESLFSAFSGAIDFMLRAQKERELRQIFRAVAVAVNATRIVPRTDATHYDLIPRVASWITAVETLVHPGTGQVGLKQVLDLVRRIRWFDDGTEARDGRKLSCEIHPIVWNGKKEGFENSAANYYRRLYNLRNDLAHGNPLDDNRFSASAIVRNGCRIDEIVPLLFRECLLERFREIGVVARIPTDSQSLDEFQRGVHEHLDGATYHDAFARALLGPAEDDM